MLTSLHMLSLTSRDKEFILLDVISSPRFKDKIYLEMVFVFVLDGVTISHALFSG